MSPASMALQMLSSTARIKSWVRRLRETYLAAAKDVTAAEFVPPSDFIAFKAVVDEIHQQASPLEIVVLTMAFTEGDALPKPVLDEMLAFIVYEFMRRENKAFSPSVN